MAMTKNDTRYRAALAEIAKIAATATAGPKTTPVGDGNGDPGSNDAGHDVGCTVKALPPRLQEKAARNAVRINPLNAPSRSLLVGRPGLPVPLAIIVDTSRYWGAAARRLSVSFMESTPADLRARIISHLNAWSAGCGMSFAETGGIGEVRISRGPGGYYSYLGTDVTLIPTNRQTMNLEGFTMNHPESEFRRVVRHEAGHTLGFPHEHMRRELVERIDPAKAYAYFWQTQGWDQATVDAQVLTPLDDASIYGTPADEDSIMCYQLPGEITYDGQPIRGGFDINSWDSWFAGQIYPPTGSAVPAPRAPQYAAEDWDESEDVLTPV